MIWKYSNPFNNLRLAAAILNSAYKLYHLKPPISAAVTYKVRPFLNQVGSDSQNLPVQSTWRSEHYLPSKTVKIFGKSKIVPSFNDFLWVFLTYFGWVLISDSLYFDVWTLIVKKISSLCEGVNWRIIFFIIIYLIGSKLLIV